MTESGGRSSHGHAAAAARPAPQARRPSRRRTAATRTVPHGRRASVAPPPRGHRHDVAQLHQRRLARAQRSLVVLVQHGILGRAIERRPGRREDVVERGEPRPVRALVQADEVATWCPAPRDRPPRSGTSAARTTAPAPLHPASRTPTPAARPPPATVRRTPPRPARRRCPPPPPTSGPQTRLPPRAPPPPPPAASSGWPPHAAPDARSVPRRPAAAPARKSPNRPVGHGTRRRRHARELSHRRELGRARDARGHVRRLDRRRRVVGQRREAFRSEMRHRLRLPSPAWIRPSAARAAGEAWPAP